MTEAVMSFIDEYIPSIIGTGVGMGSLLGLIAILIGYGINKVTGFINDK